MKLRKVIIYAFAIAVLFTQGVCNINAAKAKRLSAPSHLVAWHSGTYVQLCWDSNSDESIVGYNIYRSANSNGGWKKLTPSTFPLTVFVDYFPPLDEIVYYRVTAVNLDGNESSDSIPAEVKFRRISKNQAMQALAAPSLAAASFDTCICTSIKTYCATLKK